MICVLCRNASGGDPDSRLRNPSFPCSKSEPKGLTSDLCSFGGTTGRVFDLNHILVISNGQDENIENLVGL